MVTLRNPEQIDREIKDIKKLMRRFKENGDLRRLAKLKGRLAQLGEDVETLKTVATARLAARRAMFRRSYRYESWAEDLLMGRKIRNVKSCLGCQHR